MIYWDVSPEIFSVGPISIRWYGLLFAASFVIGYQLMFVIFKKEGRREEELHDLVWYMVLGTVIGARLGHCFFYNPAYYLNNPIEILQVWKGGLASHGAAVGILIAVYLFVRKRRQISFLWIMDRIIITVALAGFFIRMGNLFNSEIYGKPTDLPWAFVFASVDGIPRHPTQIYEAVVYLLSFLFLLSFYFRSNGKFKNGLLLGLFLLLVFGFRIFVEFFKEVQEHFEVGMMLNMGQLLSIPLVIFGIFLLIRKDKKIIRIQ